MRYPATTTTARPGADHASAHGTATAARTGRRCHRDVRDVTSGRGAGNVGDRARPAAPGAGSSGVRLTAFGALLAVFVPTLLGGLLDGVFTPGYGACTAVGFVFGCLAAAARARTEALLALAVSTPLLFVAGVAAAETLRSWGSGNWFRNEVVAITMALAGNAVWIVAAAAATGLIALTRSYTARRTAPSNARPVHQQSGRHDHPRRGPPPRAR